ncbi:hypothetical protein [Sphingobium boeckii]|uniref:Uncharacterized protein n=1 Tax=Sphingobium boeckii TaxID=1082345 RepID=A0A7W9ED37_9SPHN|nr:hypothetical protein [Sphingobium boeckii]MBB5684722.1 hypothetical protein [Sphingobium boeckii]
MSNVRRFSPRYQRVIPLRVRKNVSNDPLRSDGREMDAPGIANDIDQEQ